MKLTAKQKEFCSQYLVDLNATQAAIRAGYSTKGARVCGSRLLTNTNIQSMIAEKRKKIADDAEVRIADILRELKRIAFSKISDYVTFGPRGVAMKGSEDMTEKQLAAIAEVGEAVSHSKKARKHKTIRFKLYNKIPALELLGRYVGAFDDKQTVTGNFKLEIVFGPNGEPIDGPDAGK